MRYKLIITALSILVACIFTAIGLFYFRSYQVRQGEQPFRNTPISVDFGHNLGSVKSNQWYSSLEFHFPTHPIYALPLAYKVSDAGVHVSYPQVKKTPKTIFAPFTEEFVVRSGSGMSEPKITRVGDWHIQFEQTAQDGESLTTTIAHGAPFVTFTPSDSLVIGFLSAVSGDFGAIQPNRFSFSVKGNKYIVVTERDVQPVVSADSIEFRDPGKSVLYLVADTALEDHIPSKPVEITETVAMYSVTNNSVKNTYSMNTDAGEAVPLALFPHHTKHLATKHDIVGSYASIRGDLSLVITDEFVTRSDVPELPLTFQELSPVPEEYTTQLKTDIRRALDESIPESRSYFLGTWLGKMATLIQLADVSGLTNERDALIEKIKPVYIEALNLHAYSSDKTSVISSKPEFGNEELNDHHFHYGYFIRTGAVVAGFDPEFGKSIEKQVNLLVADIATTDRTSGVFPYIRNFDVYEGHSWADGDAAFHDGNNQESSSEALNAWYSLYLWAQVTHDDELARTAQYLFATELSAIKMYWFGEHGVYEDEYAHSIASIVWGGKVDFATWFSGEATMIYGIQLLPFTPASSYLGSFEDFDRYQADFVNSGGTIENAWGDLFVMWKSFYDEEIIGEKDRVKEFYDRNPRSLFLYFLYLNSGENT